MTRCLVTLDVHEHPDLCGVLVQCGEMLSARRINSSFFVPSAYCKQFPSLAVALRYLRRLGHSVGCHGRYHTAEEAYGYMPPEIEREWLRVSKEQLEDAVGESVVWFRAPNFSLGAHTARHLAELGYVADFSVTPQRLPLFSSFPWCFGWLKAPRKPYRPSATDPFVPGAMGLVEIPTSSLVLPLAQGAIANLPSACVALLTDLLVLEAGHFDRIVVTMIHPESVVGRDEPWDLGRLSWREFFPRPIGGVAARYRIIEKDASVIRERVHMLLSRLASKTNLEFMSADELFICGLACSEVPHEVANRPRSM